MQERSSEIEAAGGSVIGVSRAADFQAQWLRDKKGIEFPLLLDPNRALRETLGFQRMNLWLYLHPKAWWGYLKGWLRGATQGRPTGDTDEIPGVLIIDRHATLRYRYEGRFLGDYPKLDDVIAALREIAADPSP